jgi:hypothetical protein
MVSNQGTAGWETSFFSNPQRRCLVVVDPVAVDVVVEDFALLWVEAGLADLVGRGDECQLLARRR